MNRFDLSLNIEDFLNLFNENSHLNTIREPNNCVDINKLTKDEIFKIFEFLPLADIEKFSKISEITLNEKNRYLKSVKKVDFTYENEEDVGNMLDLIPDKCPFIESIRVYKFFYLNEMFFDKIAKILDKCKNLKYFIGWLPNSIFSKITCKTLNLRKVFIDMTDVENADFYLKKFINLKEIVIRCKEDYIINKKNMETIGNLPILFTDLERLSIRSVKLDNEAKRKITKFKYLTHFEVIGSNYRDIDVENIVQDLPNLKHLGLCGNNITFRGVLVIKEFCKDLTSLDIMVAGCDNCSETFRILCEEDCLPNLKFLYVRKWPLVWHIEFNKSKPMCKVIDFETWKHSFE